MQRVAIIIDGSNFYHRLKETGLKHLLMFRYDVFASFLFSGRTESWKRYYIGAIREEAGNEKSRELMRNQRILTGSLTRYDWDVQYGHMLKAEDGYHEKGVDVLMSVDMLVGAYENQYDTLVLVSSDTDLIPALIKIRSMGKQVEYVGFSSLPSYGLIKHSDVRRLLTRGDLERSFINEND